MHIRFESDPQREFPTNPERVYRGNNGHEYHWALSGNFLRGQLFQRQAEQLVPVGETLAISRKYTDQIFFFAAAKGCFRLDR